MGGNGKIFDFNKRKELLTKQMEENMNKIKKTLALAISMIMVITIL